MEYKLYEVGGKVRDEFLGIKSKDIDYSVVLSDIDAYETPLDAFNEFLAHIKEEGYKVHLPTPECFTIRAKFPKGHTHEGIDADFVLARKELGYIKGTREPRVVLGTLKDDLVRRDFTVNSLAKDLEGNIVDLFKGQQDLMQGLLRTPLDAAISFNKDPLRLIRALRFSVTKKFMFSDEIIEAIKTFPYDGLVVVSNERIREELNKMFEADTKRSLQILFWLEGLNPMLYLSIFDKIKLIPSLKN